jgi:O-antigen/teichoic acid export membrane protein
VSDVDRQTDGQQPANLRQRVLRGGLIMSLAAVALRTSSFLAQLILGRLLVEEDFGIYALALSFVAIHASLRSVMRPVLIEALSKDPAEADYLHRCVVWGLGALALVGMALAVPVSEAFDRPRLAPLLMLMLALMPFQLASIRGAATISHAMAFGNAGRLETAAGLLRHITTVIAAVAGLGPYSFVAGAAAAAATEVVMVRRYLGSWPSLRPPDWSKVRARAAKFFESGATRRWIWVSALALSLGSTGDYLGASITAPVAVVGVYFFAYQLTGALFAPMSLAAGTVLVPAFTRIEGQEARRDSYVETLWSLSVVGVLFFFSVASVAAPLTHLLWGGRWDEAAFAIVAFAAYGPIRLTHPVTLNVARACGYWSLFVSDMIATGVVVFTAAAIGAAIGGLQSLVLWVLCGHLALAVVVAVRLGWRLGLSWLSVMRVTLVPSLIGAGALAATHLIGPSVTSPRLVDGVINGALMAVLLTATIVIPQRKLLTGLVTSVRARKSS